MSISPLTPNNIRKFMNVDWVEITKKGHVKFKHRVTGYVITLSFHRKKGKPVSEHDLRNIAKYYRIPKGALVDKIRELK